MKLLLPSIVSKSNFYVDAGNSTSKMLPGARETLGVIYGYAKTPTMLYLLDFFSKNLILFRNKIRLCQKINF